MKNQIKDPFTISPDFQSLPEVSSRYWEAPQIQNNGEANFSIHYYYLPVKSTYLPCVISHHHFLWYDQYVQMMEETLQYVSMFFTGLYMITKIENYYHHHLWPMSTDYFIKLRPVALVEN